MSDEPVKEAAFFTTIRSWGLVRSDKRVLGGVLGGVGARIGMAPAPARILFVVIAIFTGGIALLAYAAAWALLPDSQGTIIIQDFGRGRPNVGALVGLSILTIIGLITLDRIGLGDWRWWRAIDGGSTFPIGSRFLHLLAVLIPLAIIAGIVALIVWAVKSSRTTTPPREAAGYARLPDGTIPTAPAAAEAVADAGAGPVAEAGTAAMATAVAAPPAPPVYTPPANTSPVYTAPPKPRVPGPGKVGYLLALAWIPITIAITILLATNNRLAVFPGLAAFVIYVAGLGLILMITAASGRKLGFLGFVSVLALIPMTLTIAYADDIRQQYVAGDWRGWVNDHVGNLDDPVSEPEISWAEPDPFNPGLSFADYSTVAINGSCYMPEELWQPDLTGTVRLATVPTDQSITVTSTDTLLSIPRGTNLTVINSGGMDGWASVNVTWADREVSCDLSAVDAPAVQLSNPDAPMLTVYLDDTLTDGYQTLWIEEN